jgi:Ni/Co efflux regulator RcnB
LKIGLKHLAVPVALLAGSPAAAQVWHNSMPAPPVGIPTPNQGWGVGSNGHGRWGGMIGGRWEGGMRAPGGWEAYRRPARGWQLPGYWMSGGFQIHDFQRYRLRRPPQGHFWVRYYDDAVLVDGYGRVSDWSGGIAWDGGAYADADVDIGYGSAAAAASASAGGGSMMSVDPNAYYGVQGGYAPPVAGGPPAVQMQGCNCPGYGAGYQYQQGSYGHGYGAQYGYGAGYAGGYYYGAPTTTTIVISSGAASVTTTTTETIEEEVIGGGEEVVTEYVETYRAAPVYRAPRPVYRAPDKRVYRTPDKRVYRTPAPVTGKRRYRK